MSPGIALGEEPGRRSQPLHHRRGAPRHDGGRSPSKPGALTGESAADLPPSPRRLSCGGPGSVKRAALTRAHQPRTSATCSGALLEARSARFLVVGAHALAVHGVPRATGDLDVWIAVDADNADRVLAALVRFGAPLAAIGDLPRRLPARGAGHPDRPARRGASTSSPRSAASRSMTRGPGASPTRLAGMAVPFLGRTSLVRQQARQRPRQGPAPTSRPWAKGRSRRDSRRPPGCRPSTGSCGHDAQGVAARSGLGRHRSSEVDRGRAEPRRLHRVARRPPPVPEVLGSSRRPRPALREARCRPAPHA